MSLTLKLPLTIFRNLIFSNSCKLLSTSPSICKRKDVNENLLEELDEYEADAVGSKKAKIVEVTANSMRLDLVLKAGLGISRNKIELAFYESKIRKNGKKALKKSEAVNVGDEIDLINDRPTSNPKILNVSRIKLLDATLEEDKYRIKLFRDKNLLIEDETAKY